MIPNVDTGSSGGGGTVPDEDETRSSSSSSRSSNTQSSSRSRPRPPQKTDVGDTDESKETSSPDVNELLREAENIDKDGRTTTEHVDSTPSSGPPEFGGSGGSTPGDDPYEDPEPESGGEPTGFVEGMKAIADGEAPGGNNAGLSTGTGAATLMGDEPGTVDTDSNDASEGPIDWSGNTDGEFDPTEIGNDAKEEVDKATEEAKNFIDENTPSSDDFKPEVNVSSKPLAYVLVAVGLLWAGVSGLGGGS